MPRRKAKSLPKALHGFCISFAAILLLLVALPTQVMAEDSPTAQSLHVAVASNFLFPLKQLAKRFQQETGIDLITSGGSTGTLYAQISNGAPFDVFLAADKRRPRLLVEKGFAVKGSRITYAYGQIVLWGNDRLRGPEKNSGNCLARLKKAGRLAIANPNTAPYGTAAKESLQKLGLWEDIKPRIVYGNNIAHTFQFIHTGNVDFGIVALPEYLRKGQQNSGCSWIIPNDYYTPIEQQAVLLNRAKNNINAAKFMAFLADETTQKFLVDLGYGTP